MTDIDFDELDKAVSSLMSSVPKNAPVKNDDIKTITIAPKLSGSLTGSPFEQPVPAHSLSPSLADVAPVPSVSTPSAAQSASRVSLAERRGGRFMDVVHPSSDMKRQNLSETPSRQGLTIEPRAGMPSAPEVSDPILVQAPSALMTEESDSLSAVVTEKHPAPDSQWPDPLDMLEETPPAGSQATQDSSTVETTAAEPEPATEPIKPMATPFLSDAKVEKRPLGGVVSADQSDDISNTTEPDFEDTDSQLPPEPTEIEMPLPEELSTDLIAIESDNATVSQVTPAAEPVSEKPASEPASAGPSSIQQQYKEEPSTGDQTSGAIFDTATYHQPLAHPARKNMSWLWIVAIIVVLLLGAAGGAALYFLGIV